MKTLSLLIALTLSAASATGCAKKSLMPESVPLDRVECARCRMLISTDSGGGEIVSAHEETRFYDDIGCLAADWRARSGDGRAFVRIAGEWSDATDASFARPAAVATAMGSGIVAFALVAEARAADREGRALTFDEVVRMSGAPE